MATAKEKNCISYLQILYAAVTTKLNKASGMRLNIQNTIKTYLQLNKISEASQGMPAFCCAYEHELALVSLRNSITFSKTHVSELVSNPKCPMNLVSSIGSIVYASSVLPDLPNINDFIKNLQKLWSATEIQILRTSPQIPDILKHLRKRDSFTLEEQHAFAHHIENNLHFDCTWFYQANPINDENSPERVDHVILSGRRISLPPSEPVPQSPPEPKRASFFQRKSQPPIHKPIEPGHILTLEDYDRLVFIVNEALKKWDTWTQA